MRVQVCVIANIICFVRVQSPHQVQADILSFCQAVQCMKIGVKNCRKLGIERQPAS